MLGFVATRKALRRHVIHNEEAMKDVTSCFTYCLLVPECVSFNYEASSQVCQLNNATSTQFPQDLYDTQSLFQYYERISVLVMKNNFKESYDIKRLPLFHFTD